MLRSTVKMINVLEKDYRLTVGSQKKRVEIYKRIRVDMIIKQADKPNIWEVMKSWN